MLPPLDGLPSTLRVAPGVCAADSSSLQTPLAAAAGNGSFPVCQIIRSLIPNKDDFQPSVAEVQLTLITLLFFGSMLINLLARASASPLFKFIRSGLGVLTTSVKAVTHVCTVPLGLGFKVLWYFTKAAMAFSLCLVSIVVGLALSDDWDQLVLVLYTGEGVFSPTKVLPHGLQFIRNNTSMARYSEAIGNAIFEAYSRRFGHHAAIELMQARGTQIALALCGATTNLLSVFWLPVYTGYLNGVEILQLLVGPVLNWLADPEHRLAVFVAVHLLLVVPDITRILYDCIRNANVRRGLNNILRKSNNIIRFHFHNTIYSIVINRMTKLAAIVGTAVRLSLGSSPLVPLISVDAAADFIASYAILVENSDIIIPAFVSADLDNFLSAVSKETKEETVRDDSSSQLDPTMVSLPSDKPGDFEDSPAIAPLVEDEVKLSTNEQSAQIDEPAATPSPNSEIDPADTALPSSKEEVFDSVLDEAQQDIAPTTASPVTSSLDSDVDPANIPLPPAPECDFDFVPELLKQDDVTPKSVAPTESDVAPVTAPPAEFSSSSVNEEAEVGNFIEERRNDPEVIPSMDPISAQGELEGEASGVADSVEDDAAPHLEIDATNSTPTIPVDVPTTETTAVVPRIIITPPDEHSVIKEVEEQQPPELTMPSEVDSPLELLAAVEEEHGVVEENTAPLKLTAVAEVNEAAAEELPTVLPILTKEVEEEKELEPPTQEKVPYFEQAVEHPAPELIVVAEQTEQTQNAPVAPENEPEVQMPATLPAQTGQAEDAPAPRGPRLVMTSALRSALTSVRNDKRRADPPPAASTSTPATTIIPTDSPSNNSTVNDESTKVKRVRKTRYRRRNRNGRGSKSTEEDAIDQPDWYDS